MSENSGDGDEDNKEDNDGSSSESSESEAEQDGPHASAEVDATAEVSTGLPQVQERDDINGDSSLVSDAEGSEEVDTSEEEDDDDDDDEEPTLRYSRIQSSALNERLFAKGQDTCSALAVSDKYLVLGTNNGAVCILARPGHSTGAQNGAAATPAGATASQQKIGAVVSAAANDVDEDAEGQLIVKRYRPHQAGVTEVVIDEESQFVGSASTDGERKRRLGRPNGRRS